MTNAICVIPARGGSRRIPRKNIKNFHGKPIIAYSIETALASRLFTHVVVSTEDDEIAEIAAEYGAKALWRPPDLACDEVGTQDVMRNVLTIYSGFAWACCLYPCAPLLWPRDLQRAAGTREAWACAVYVQSTDYRGYDAGAFYMGHVDLFDDTPLAGNTVFHELPAERCIDINTEDDWAKAEAMYTRMNTVV